MPACDSRPAYGARLVRWWSSGNPWVWLNAAAIGLCICLVMGVLLLIAVKGIGHFWPRELSLVHYQEPGHKTERLLGEIFATESVSGKRAGVAAWEINPDTGQAHRRLLKVGNREWYGLDFRWVSDGAVQSITTPDEATLVRRYQGGNVYGFLQSLETGVENPEGRGVDESELADWIGRSNAIHQATERIENKDISPVSRALEALRIEERRLQRQGHLSALRTQQLDTRRGGLTDRYEHLQQRIQGMENELAEVHLVLVSADGQTLRLPIADVIEVMQPNRLSWLGKLRATGRSIWTFLSEEPREANTAGGVFPAIFGTVVMVLFMSVLVTPFGVIAAVYLHEYARQNTLTYLVRISVNNLAGVPSIVYGVFGLGFFVYVLGGSIDHLFYPDALPSPTFGTGGLMWASLTLALLTVPVVIVATEEGLARVPRALREGSYALGATRAETLWRTVLPMASPAVMTGVILAIARAAGEVAPLMLVGVVKMAPALPVDTVAPFFHLERKFMHLGFHIYDVGFQSPNVEAARPLVYATALLLIVIIVALNLAAMVIRNRLRESYKAFE